MTTLTNTPVTQTAWTSILTSSDGAATIEARLGDIEYAYSTTTLSSSEYGLTLAMSRYDADGFLITSQLRVDRALTSGQVLYARALGAGVSPVVCIAKDTELFGS